MEACIGSTDSLVQQLAKLCIEGLLLQQAWCQVMVGREGNNVFNMIISLKRQ